MNKFKKNIFIFLILILFIYSSVNVYSKSYIENLRSEKVYKVGFYQHPPYYYLNDKSQPAGYYHELMELISKNLNIKYEYVNLNISECIDTLINNKIDLLFGVNKDSERINNLLFSSMSIAKEDISVYTNKNIKQGNLYDLEGLRFGYLKNESNFNSIFAILERRNINVKPIEYLCYESLKNALISKEIDSTLLLSSDSDLKEYNKILYISVGELYISSSLKNDNLIDNIDSYFENLTDSKYNNEVGNLYNSYFDKKSYFLKNISSIFLIIILCLSLLLAFIIYKHINKKFKLKKLKGKVLLNLYNNNYLLHYQPIINPKTNTVKGFEGLLRLKDGENIISPYFFLKDIEKTNMMSKVTLMILEKTIHDYNIIKNYTHILDDKFYISINLSFKEIEDDQFIESIKDLLEKSNLKPNSICLEIVERLAINDLQKIQQVIYKLKDAGFMVAIDDFGVEYSNLDILEKIDCDVIKLDKYFIDNIGTSYIRKEVIHFISNICKHTNKTLVCEGVETEHQRDVVRNIENDKFYIQGYFYSKPLCIEDLKNFKL